jgi:AAA+ ATPase superfamily predicted ATPase
MELVHDPLPPFAETFVGREEELSRLRELAERPGSQVAVVYGRRRVGKTSLIRRAFARERVLCFEGIEGKGTATQIRNFLFQLERQSGLSIPRKSECSEWTQALSALASCVEGQRVVILFDEFQWTANYRSDLVTSLKMMWDQYLERAGKVTLILCGSIASFLQKKVVQSKAFYGRTNLCIHLEPFQLRDTAKILSGRGWDEVLLAQLLVGGIPLYLKLLQAEDSILAGMGRLAFTETGYFAGEYERIFVSHFGSTGKYPEVLTAIAEKPFGLSRLEIVERTGAAAGGEFTRVLDNLESAGFVGSYVPFDKPDNSRLIRYFISDPFLRFHLAFLVPKRSRRAPANRGFLEHVVPSPQFRSWLGRGFELLCLDHSAVIAEILGFAGVEYRTGPYFRHGKGGMLAGVQIDLLFDRADRVVTLCELKYRDARVGIEVTREVAQKIARVPQLAGKTVQKVLITRSEPTRELVRSGFFSRIIPARELLQA